MLERVKLCRAAADTICGRSLIDLTF